MRLGPALGAMALALVGCERATPAGAGETASPSPGSSPASAGASGAAPPVVESVLLITVDTLRADALGFAGNQRAATPALDRLAAGGLVFARAHAHNVVTLPSHANILTGLHPYEHGIRDNSGFVLPAEIPTAATLLSAAGFSTAAFVGAFPLDARFGLARGFEVYDDRYPEGSHQQDADYAERRGDQVVGPALEWWRAQSGRRRFLWVHLFDPHAPYAPPEPWASRFAADPYLGEVAAVDAFLAPLLDEATGGDASALVIFTADHGEALGEHGELTHGLFAYEPTLRVPLVLWAPGLAAGRSDRPASHVDLLPTLLAATGVTAPPGLPGRPLVGGDREEAPATYFEALSANLDRGWAPLRGAIRDGRKFIALPEPELYDLEQDPGERRNLAAEERAAVRELAALLPAESAWPPARGPVAAEERAALRSLGYLGGAAAAKQSYGVEDDPKRLVELDRKLHQALHLYRTGELAEAASMVREVMERRPDMGVAYYQLAQIQLEAGRRDEALATMEEARRRGVASDELLRQLGLTLAEAGRAGEGVALLRPLAAGGDPDALNALGLVLTEGGRQEEAAAVLQRVFDRDSRNPQAHQNLALVALRRQRWAEARDQAERALALNRDLALAWNYLGAARYNLGQPASALDAWERAVALESDFHDVLYNIAVVAMEVGERDRARSALERFVASAPPERYGPDLEKARRMLRQIAG